MKSSMKRSGFRFQTWKFQKPPKSFILEWLINKKDDTGSPSHFHVLNLFKSWSNLGFDQDTNGHKKMKNKKHIVFLCHIVSIKVDKQGLDIFKPYKSCIYPLTPKLCLMKSSRKRSGFGFQTWKFQKPPKNFILGWLRRIQASLFIFMF